LSPQILCQPSDPGRTGGSEQLWNHDGATNHQVGDHAVLARYRTGGQRQHRRVGKVKQRHARHQHKQAPVGQYLEGGPHRAAHGRRNDGTMTGKQRGARHRRRTDAPQGHQCRQAERRRRYKHRHVRDTVADQPEHPRAERAAYGSEPHIFAQPLAEPVVPGGRA
jgi:hypothetical protein